MTLSVRESLSFKLSNVSDISKRLQKQPCIPFRYLVIFFMFLVSAISFSVRNVLNFAILAMVDEESPSSIDTNSSMVQSEIKFNWDQRDQGFVLGAYFYTYTAAQIVSGILTDKFNAVHLLTASQIIASVCSFLSPILAEYGIFYFIAIRMILGLAHGILFPSCFILVERWLSPGEIAVAQSFVLVGGNFGIIVIMPLTAWLCESGFIGGWPSAFYITAVVNIIFIVFWSFAITLDPSTNRWVSPAEKDMIAHINSSKTAKIKIDKTPWKSLFTSLPLWSVMISRGINGLVYYAINTKIPVYMETVLGYKLKGNGAINSLLYIALCSAQLISGPASRGVINKKWLSKTVTRKVFQSIALVGTGLSLTVIPSLGDRSDYIVIVLILSMFFVGFTVGGDTPIIPEMAPHLVGTTFGFANTLACAAGFTAPIITAAMLGDQVQSKNLWNKTFYTFAGLQFIGFIVFVCFATAEPQPWGTIETKETAREKQAKSRSNDKKTCDISSKV